ncbi:hypothetical protein N7493_009074 [Penicillium malachiteum]|uniref:Uncharacterized protein n=1 Tax=Penicillium malachiteum TaxID=1324776 RepID=A0AAD6MT15_9EURO|nr:hypothetical protein N7493_009074 [Penicillium malachiteum]
MSWDRVIQDSDDDEEPLIEDDFPVSPDPLQPTQSPKVQHQDNPAEAETHYPIERTTNEGFPEPQLNVNFDQFLQSQGTHAASTSSQQQREERWIPSTESGGSIGAMMTEIGLAQTRLFDESSSAAQRISTTTYYPSEISQPGSFPTMQSYQYQQNASITSGNVQYTNIPRDQPYEATQLLTPSAVPACDYSLPTTASHVDSPSDVTTAPTSAPYLAMAYSPHDTEPFSSVASPRVNMSKTENPMPGLKSPHHFAGDAHDELAFSGVTVEVPSATKKRRSRPKKASLPEDDDDDELAIATGTEPTPTRPTEKSSGDFDLPTVAAEQAIKTAPVGDAATGIPKTTEVVSAPEENTVPETGSATIEQPQKSNADDDVIWVDSRALETNGAQETEAKEPAPKKRGRKRKQATERIADDLDSVSNTDSNATDEKPAPKKRGRKRKPPVELVEPEVQDPVSKDDAPVTDIEKIEEPKGTTPEAEAEVAQQPDPEPKADTVIEKVKEQAEVPPQTPQKPEQDPSTPAAGNSTNARKGLSKHSPISSTSKVPYRVGLSKRARIAPLLKMVRK